MKFTSIKSFILHGFSCNLYHRQRFKKINVRRYLMLLFWIGCIGFAHTQDLILDLQSGVSTAVQSVRLATDDDANTTSIKHPFEFASQSTTEEGILFLNLTNNIHQNLWQNKSATLQLAIPVNATHEMVLELQKIDILAADFALELSSGSKDFSLRKQIAFYEGTVKNHGNAKVSTTIHQKGITIFIRDERGNYTLSKLKNTEQYVFYNEMRHVTDTPPSCLVEDDFPSYTATNESTNVKSGLNGCPVYMHLEVDHESYSYYIDNNQTVNDLTTYLVNLFATVVQIYSDHNIPLKLSGIKVWDTPDPFGEYDRTVLVTPTTQDAENYLNAFIDHLDATGFRGKIAHFVSIYSTGFGGLAALDQLCGHRPYGINGIDDTYAGTYPAFSSSVDIVAHELAHNFGARHTHSCSWGANNDTAIDNCAAIEDGPCSPMNDTNNDPNYVGTIMSYCSPKTLSFNSEVASLLVSKYQTALTSCITDYFCDLYVDGDGDGFGSTTTWNYGDSGEASFYNNDPNDNDANLNARTVEDCSNGVDDNGNGLTDENTTALLLDGVDDEVNLGNTLGNFGASDFTIDFKIKTTTAGRYILSKRAVCNIANFWNISINGDGKINFEFIDPTNNISTNGVGETVITDGNWHHVAIARLGTSYGIFVDGSEDLNGARGNMNGADLNNTADLTIGTNICGNYFQGEIDELRIWNKGLVPTTIRDFANAHLPTTTPGLTAYYDFDNITAGQTTIADRMGTYNGTLNNFNFDGSSSDWVGNPTQNCMPSANTGAALAYDGNGDIVTVADDPLLDLTTELTIEFWIKPVTNTHGYQIYVMKANHGGWGSGYGMVSNTSNNLHFMPTGWYGTGHIDATYTFSTTEWTHVAGTFDGTNSIIYINGVETFTQTVTQTSIPQNNNVLEIGGDVGFPSYTFNGEMDEVRVWNRALTEAEIVANMNCEIQGGMDNLVVNYHFNQGEAGEDNSNPAVDMLTDDSDNNLHGTLANFSLIGTASNWIAPGSPASGNACIDNEIEILGGSPLTSIVSGSTTTNTADGTDFGTQTLNGTTSQTFTIRNTGTEALTLTGSPIVEITNDAAGVFSVATQPSGTSIAANGSDLTFTIDYTPTTLGNYTATVSIANDDSNENPYTFTISGTTPGCDFAINSVIPTDQSCPNQLDGTITVTATCNNCTNGNSDLRYALNGGTPQASSVFDNLAAGDYTVTVSNVGGGTCTATEVVTVGDNAPSAAAFVTTWVVTDDNDPNTTNDFLVELFNSDDFPGSYQVDWGDCSVDNNTYQDAATHTYAAPGTYRISITGDFPAPNFAFSSTKEKLVQIDQWGTQQWEWMGNAFSDCINMTYHATDIPNLSLVTDVSYMFFNATSFDGDIGNWDVSTIQDFSGMLEQASVFNQDLSSWNISSASSMFAMLSSATSFDQNLANWNIPNGCNLTNLFTNSGMSTASYDATLTGWASKTTPATNVNMTNQSGMKYCESASDRADLINTHSWTIDGDANDCSEGAFITTWEVMAGDLSITIPMTFGFAANYFVDWGDGMVSANHTSSASHTYAAPGTYTVMIRGNYPGIRFANGGDKEKIKTIEQWGNIVWRSMSVAFQGCTNLTHNASDAPDLSNITSLFYTFQACTNFDGDLSNWDVSNVTDFTGVFRNTDVFNGPIGSWNVSSAEDMYEMFFEAKAFNQPLAAWEGTNSTTANISNMRNMFYGATAFNQDISNWNVSGVDNMAAMFYQATSFNQPLANWERTGSTLANVTDINFIVNQAAAFNQDISNWNITGVTSLSNAIVSSGMDNTNYDRLLNGWGSQNVQPNLTFNAFGLNYCAGEPGHNLLTGTHNWTINDGGRACDFDAFVTTWAIPADDLTLQFPIYGSGMTIDWGDGNMDNNQSSLPSHTYTTTGNYTITINGNISQVYFAWRNNSDKDQIQTIEQWGTTTWASMNYAFAGCENVTSNATDNPDLSNITTLYFTFADAPNFDGDLSGWNVSTVTNMYGTFRGATTFNGDISSWVVDNVTDMGYLFAGATNFNQNISSWKVDEVTRMQAMFRDASSFNQDISGWNTSKVTDMAYIFQNAAAFDQNLGGWDITQLQSRYSLYLALLGTNISTANYDAILMGWEGQAVPDGLWINTDLKYCAGKDARAALIRNHNWRFSGDGRDINICPGAPFVTTWKTTAANESVVIYTNSYSNYNFNVDWGDGQMQENVTGTIAHSYGTPGEYQVSIVGDFPHFLAANYWQDAVNARKLMSIDEWGEIEWKTMDAAFAYAENMTYDAIDMPDLSQVYSTGYMFYGAKSFSANLNDWDISKIYNMSGMFSQATNFNGNLSKWDMNNVSYIYSMFSGASSFNQDITNWETGNILGMYGMFYRATNFNQDLSRWDFSALDDRYPQWALSYAFGYSGMDKGNYDDLLIRLREQADDIPMNTVLGGRSLEYCVAKTQRMELVNDYNWNITDGGEAAGCTLRPNDDEQLRTATNTSTPNEVLIYPNPANEVLTILLNSKEQYDRIIITDVMGRKVFEQPLHHEQLLLTVPVANGQFATGMYNVTLQGSSATVTQQVAVQR